MTVKERLNEIENRYEHQKETAEYAGISMILGDYEFLIQQAKRAQNYRESVRTAIEEAETMRREAKHPLAKTETQSYIDGIQTALKLYDEKEE